MAKTFRHVAPFLLLLPLAACTANVDSSIGDKTEDLRGLSKTEALSELTHVGEAIRAYYGPLEFKKARYGFDLDAALAEAKGEIEAGQSEADRVRPIFKLLSKLKDGHISYQFPLRSDQTAENTLPVLFMPVEGAYLVAGAAANLGVKRGDELVSIDGLGVKKLEELLMPISEAGTPAHTSHFVAANMTFRPFYVPNELAPKGATARVVLKRADGTEYTVDVPWRIRAGGLAGQVTPPITGPEENPTSSPEGTRSARTAYLLTRSVEDGAHASLLEYGDLTPFFLTPPVRSALGVVEVAPKTATLTELGVTIPPGEDTKPDEARYIQMRAYKYKHAGKTVLLVRIPAFSVAQQNYDENVAWLAALMKDNLRTATGGTLADTPADVMVVDDTHNPGGAVPYVTGLASLFTTKAIPNQVQAHHADRKWMQWLLGAANQSDAQEQPVWLDRLSKLEAAYDNGTWLAPPVPFVGSFRGPTVPADLEGNAGDYMLAAHPLVKWSKPTLVLTDELSVSGGDAFPMILKNAGVAKTFGAATGGLGGSVEEVLIQPYSRSKLRLTRGLFGSHNPSGEMATIENVGVAPTFPHPHTAADFRAGFVGYAKAFSDAAVHLTAVSPRP